MLRKEISKLKRAIWSENISEMEAAIASVPPHDPDVQTTPTLQSCGGPDTQHDIANFHYNLNHKTRQKPTT